jgi:hypothetical protein
MKIRFRFPRRQLTARFADCRDTYEAERVLEGYLRALQQVGTPPLPRRGRGVRAVFTMDSTLRGPQVGWGGSVYAGTVRLGTFVVVAVERPQRLPHEQPAAQGVA